MLQEYIHRVGRTARGEGGIGNALLILTPEELGFIRYLKAAKVPVSEFEFSWSKVANIQNQVCALKVGHSCWFLLNICRAAMCYTDFCCSAFLSSFR